MGTSFKIITKDDMTPAQRKRIMYVLAKAFRAASLTVTGKAGGTLKIEHAEEAY